MRVRCALGGVRTRAGTPAAARLAWWLPAAAAVVTALLMYGQDHVVVEWNVRQQGAVMIASMLLVLAIFGGIVTVTALTIGPIVSVSIGGMGAGLLAYRLVYGVVLPVPRTRLEKIRDRTA